MKKDKGLAKDDCMKVVSNSWAWARLTMTEQDCFSDLVAHQKLQGTYYQRRDILQSMYSAYLRGLGYEPVGWREGARKEKTT